MTAGNQYLLVQVLGRRDLLFRWGMFLIMKLFAIVASVTIFFLIYRVLPNGRLSTRQVLPAAIVCGVLWELLKHVYITALPQLGYVFADWIIEGEVPSRKGLGHDRCFENLADRSKIEQRVRRDQLLLRGIGPAIVEE